MWRLFSEILMDNTALKYWKSDGNYSNGHQNFTILLYQISAVQSSLVWNA